MASPAGNRFSFLVVDFVCVLCVFCVSHLFDLVNYCDFLSIFDRKLWLVPLVSRLDTDRYHDGY